MSIYSTKYKFCFIHIEKCAGTSIRDALSKNLKIRHFKSLFYFGPMKGIGGQKAVDYINMLGKKEYEKYFSFAIVRNPFDRLVSWYLYDNFGLNSFESWIKYFFEKINILQMDHLLDDKGNIAVKYIGRFENLQNEFDIIADKIGIERIILPHKKKYLSEKNYKDFYSKELRLFVEKKLEKEIKFLNYKF